MDTVLLVLSAATVGVVVVVDGGVAVVGVVDDTGIVTITLERIAHWSPMYIISIITIIL